MIEIPKQIIDQAKVVLGNGGELPQSIPGFPAFVVAASDDETVQAFGAITHDGKPYKIGSKKPV